MRHRIYFVRMPYPNQSKVKVRMMKVKHQGYGAQPYFFASDIKKLFGYKKIKDVMKLAVPYVDQILNTKLMSFKGYLQVCMYGNKKINRIFQRFITKTIVNSLYKMYIGKYLNTGKDEKNGKNTK